MIFDPTYEAGSWSKSTPVDAKNWIISRENVFRLAPAAVCAVTAVTSLRNHL